MSAPARKPMTVAEFLRWSETRPATERYELVDGEVVAMAPERNRHNLVKTNTVVALCAAVRRAGVPCVVLGDGATVVIDDTTAFEPDALLQCGTSIDLDAIGTDAPTVLVEVISPTAPGVDTNRKLHGYFRLSSVEHYLVLDPVAKSLLHYRRGATDEIELAQVGGGTPRLDPPGLTVAVADLFAGI